VSIVSHSSSSGWPFGWLARIFRGRKDNRATALTKMVYILDKIIEDLDASRRRMEDRYNDLAKKARSAALRGDKESHNIFLNEMDEVSKFIALIVHAKKYVLQIKLRLETMLDMGEAMDQLPTIMAELNNIKPVLAKVTPFVVEKITEFEKLVSEILVSTSVPSFYGKVKPRENAKTDTTTMSIEVKELLPPKTPPKPARTVQVSYVQTPRQSRVNRVSLSIIKKWLLEEISMANGFLIIDDFVRKYGVSKEAVLEALRQLHEEGKIVIKR